MARVNHEYWEAEALKKAAKREKKKKPKMRVSGAGVKCLQVLINRGEGPIVVKIKKKK
jgi:hypothetical protein